MLTEKLIVTGIVQGVGFRYDALQLARRIGVNGSVRNNLDGSVTIIIQASKERIASFISKLPVAASYARISAIQREEISNHKIYSSFRVVY